MADEQTADFFAPPPEDAPGPPPDMPADYAPMEGGYENVGDVDFASAPADDGGEHQAPAVLVLDEPAAANDDGADMMGFAAAPTGGDDVIIPDAPPDMMIPEAPSAEGMVEDVPASELEEMEPPKDELSPMAKFNNEWQVILRERKDHENAMKAETVEKAREDLASFQEQREKKMEQRMAKNRSDEQQKLEDLEADLENDNSWQRVVKMVELQQDTVEGAHDKKRMIDVLVNMKNDTDRAVALS